MRWASRSFGAAVVLAVMLSGCKPKVTEISVVCQPGDQPAEPVRWFYTSKVDPSLIKQISPAIDVTLHYTGADPRAVPPITTYFYRRVRSPITSIPAAISTRCSARGAARRAL